MDLEVIILSEVSQMRKTNIMWNCLYRESKKKKIIQMNLLTKQKQAHRLRELIYGYQGRRVVERDRLGIWD